METIQCKVTRCIYNDGDFNIYAAIFDNFEELSVKTNGFELCPCP